MPITTKRKGGILLVQGLDVEKPADYISDRAASNVQNLYVDRSLLTKRLGTVIRGSTIGGSDLEIMQGIEFNREGTLFNVRIGRDNVEYYDSGASSWTDITGASTLTGTADDLVSVAIPMLSGKRILCLSNGIDTIKKWTGSGNLAALGGSPPVAKFIQEYKTYLFAANIQGGVDVSQRVQWSDTLDPEEWSSGNAGSVDLVEDGEDITGLNIFGQFLCVHKLSSIYVGTLVSSTSIIQFERRVTQAGTVANGSIVNLPSGEQAFLAIDGIRLFNGVTSPLIPSPVNAELRDGLNVEKAHKAWGVLVLERDEVWIGVPIGSQEVGETVYKYNYVTRVLYKDLRSNINTAWRATQSTALTWDDFADGITWDDVATRWDAGQLGASGGEVHFGDTSGLAYVSSVGALDDNGTAIDAFWDSKDLKSDILDQILRFQEIRVWAKGQGTLSVEYSTDEGVSWISGGTITLTDEFPDLTSPARVFLDAISLCLRVRFRHNGSGSCQIKQFYVAYVPREYA